MEALEFLGGKYQQAEQILPGPIQTFRAQDAAGRPVFVHRISLTDDPQRQSSLLGLLSAALLRSPKARKMVVDVTDADGFYYVVTQTAPQCLLLREWLQCEADDPGTDGEEAKQTPVGRPGTETVVKPVSAAPPKVAPAPPESVPPPPTVPEPGEFTRMFQAITPPKPPPAKSQPPSSDTFARYFQEGLPSSPTKPVPEPQRNQDRPSKTGFVQRPNTPVPGEFTKLFSAMNNDAGAPKPQLGSVPEAGRRESDPRDFFERPPEAPSASGPSTQKIGEYTRIFGSPNSPPPIQEPSAPRQAVNKSADDAFVSTAIPQRPQPPPMPAVPKGPSEYSLVMKAHEPPPAPAAPPAPAVPVALQGVKIPSAPPVPKASAAPTAVPKNKLIVFFLILGVLAIALVVLIVLIALKK